MLGTGAQEGKGRIALYTSAIDTVVSDLTGDGIVNIDDLQIMMEDWLQGDSIADIYQDEDNIVNFKDFAILADHWLEGTLP